MRVALIAPPFISVPPKIYGGTELFLAALARGSKELGIEPSVYANGESTVDVEVRSIYQESEWPLKCDMFSILKDINHTAGALQYAASYCHALHLNNAPVLT